MCLLKLSTNFDKHLKKSVTEIFAQKMIFCFFPYDYFQISSISTPDMSFPVTKILLTDQARKTILVEKFYKTFL